MAHTKEIKHRLKSIKNTEKTTKAMELVSAAKMRKAVLAAVQTRQYQKLTWEVIARLRDSVELKPTEPLRKFFSVVGERDTDSGTVPSVAGKVRTALVLLTSNRGLCGGFNSNVIKKVLAYVREHRDSETIELIAIGKKGAATLDALKLPVKLAYDKNDSALDDRSVIEIAQYLHKQFSDGSFDKVLVAYTDYKSAITQTPVIVQLLPFPMASAIGAKIDNVDEPKPAVVSAPAQESYIYEPGKLAVLAYLIPRAAEVQLYQALLESNASEHSSRMLAMKNATDAASDMASDLLLEFNRARQASITKEIAEIAAGTAAVS